MLENYDDLTVQETLEAIADWDDDEKTQFLAFEADNKDRTGVTDELEAELGVSVADITDAELETEPEPASDDESDDGPETVEVTVTQGNYAAGLWFDDATETKVVELNSRVERALERGRLERVD